MPGFGVELWNNLESIDSLTSDGIAGISKLISFLCDLQEAEKDYAKSIEKISKKYVSDVDKLIAKEEKKARKDGAVSEHPKIELSSVNNAWKALTTELENLGKSHQTLSDSVHDDLVRLVKVQEKEMAVQRKKHLDALKASKAAYKVVLEKHTAVEKAWKNALKEKEHAQKSYEKAIQDTKVEQRDVDRLKAENEAKAKALEVATESYLRVTEETNVLQSKHFNEELRDLLDDVQKNDEISRVAFLKQSFSSLLDMYSKTVPAFEGALENMYSAVKSIDGTKDSQLFIKNNKKAEDLPKAFECMAEQLASGTVASPTVQSPIFASVEDEIITITDIKKGRKKAIDRLAALDKELKKHEMQRSLNLAAGKDVREHDRRINVVKLKVHKLNNYVARLDGRSESELPAELAAFEASLTAHDFDILETLVRATGASPSPSPVKSVSGSSHAVGAAAVGASVGQLVGSGSRRFDSSNQALDSSNLRSSSTAMGSRSSFNNSPTNLVTQTATSNVTRTSLVSGSQPIRSSANNISKGTASVGASEAEICVIGHCVALYDFDAEPGTTELSVKANQSLEILEKQDEWWNVRIPGTNQVGFVPANYCQ